MKLNNEYITLCSQPIRFGMHFLEVIRLLEYEIYTKQEPRIDGSGYIIIHKEDFYGLKGNCTLYFQKDTFCQISIEPDWGGCIIS